MAKRSHVNPARLLAQFGVVRPDAKDPDNYRQWEVVRYWKGGTPEPTRIDSIVDKKFYRLRKDDGTVDDTLEEKMANEVETPFNRFLPLFDSRLLYFRSHDQFRCIVRYVANTFCRSHQRREASHRSQNNVLALTRKIAEDRGLLLQLAAAFSWFGRGEVYLSDAKEKLLAICDSNSEWQRTAHYLESMQAYEDDIVQMLSARPYGLLRAPESEEFILGDTAAITRQPVGMECSVGVGFKVKDMHVLMPVSPKTCIQIGIPNLEDHELRPEEVASINRDQIRLMNQHVFSRTPDERIQRLVDEVGSELKYAVNTFLRPEIKAEAILDHFIKDLMNGKFSFERTG